MNKRVCLGIIAMVTLGIALVTITTGLTQFVAGFRDPNEFRTKAPVAITGDNVYVARPVMMK